MEHSRARTLLGLGLVLVGSVVLFRTALAPIVPISASIVDERAAALAAQEAQRDIAQAQRESALAQQEAQREIQQAQREMELAQREAQREMELAQREAQREMELAQREAQREAIGSAGDIAALPALPALPPLPPRAPEAPEPAGFHLGSWPNPALLLIAAGIFLFWWRGRSDHSPRQV